MKAMDSKLLNFAKMKKYLKVWLMMSKNSFLAVLSNKTVFLIFFFGKIMRFSFFALFLVFLVHGVDKVAGYGINEIIFFFLTFNLVDIIAQFLFREVYRFRQKVVSGDLDLILVNPLNSLFRVLMGGADFIDMIMIPPLLYAIFYFGIKLSPSPVQVFYYFLLIVNGLLIATAFHIAVVSMAILTLEIDHSIMIYRDLTNLARFPVDIYKEPLRGILTYLVPIGLMITIPAKAMMGLISPIGVVGSLVLGGVLFFLSTKFWNFSLKHYASASG